MSQFFFISWSVSGHSDVCSWFSGYYSFERFSVCIIIYRIFCQYPHALILYGWASTRMPILYGWVSTRMCPCTLWMGQYPHALILYGWVRTHVPILYGWASTRLPILYGWASTRMCPYTLWMGQYPHAPYTMGGPIPACAHTLWVSQFARIPGLSLSGLSDRLDHYLTPYQN